MQKTDLFSYNNSPYHPGGTAVKRLLWYYINAFVFKTSLFPVYGLKNALLRLFGAKIGQQVEIKPCVNIKYPWLLTIGNEVWIGEKVWVDNLVMVTIGSNVCISQGAMLLTGSHNYKKTSFLFVLFSRWRRKRTRCNPKKRCILSRENTMCIRGNWQPIIIYL